MAAMLPITTPVYDNGWRALPPIVSEAVVSIFSYWDDGIKVGMRYGSELYQFFDSYPISERLKATAAACEQASRGIDVCITASKTTYQIWLSLRSLSAISEYSTQKL